MISRTSVTERTVVVNGWEITAVQSTASTASAASAGLIATAACEPVAIIVRHPGGQRAFDLEGREIPIVGGHVKERTVAAPDERSSQVA